MKFALAPKDTLARWTKGTALSGYTDKSNAKLYPVAMTIQNSGMFGTQASPDMQAVDFYLLNQAMSVLAAKRDPLEPLPEGELFLAKEYAENASKIVVRLFWYVLLICTREARHNNSDVSGKLMPVHASVREKYPDISIDEVKEMFAFTKTFPDTNAALQKMTDKVTMGFRIGPFAKMLSALYYNCSWGAMFGGKKWGVIADALFSYVSGEWSAEMFADTAFTLAHNTAPIFNKGMLYAHPSGNFIELLDVQRAGMIPQWLLNDKNGLGFYNTPTVQKVHEVLPDMFTGHVDWGQVEALGAVHKYSSKPGYQKPQKPDDKYIVIDAKTSVKVVPHKRLKKAA